VLELWRISTIIGLIGVEVAGVLKPHDSLL